MATRPKSGITADTDVNLDFLTKEEKEALLSKKMDMIRQRNKALTERHKLIEADKKKAEEAGQAVKPAVDSQTLPAEGAPKPSRGRGRGQPHNKDGNRPAKERPKSSGDFRDSSNYEPIVDTTDLANYRSKGLGGLQQEREAYNNTPKSKRKPALKEEATTFPSNFEYEPIIDMKDLDKRFGALLNTLEGGSLPHADHANHPGQRHPIWRHDKGPPPDPSFNPLADRRRNDKKEESSDHRRHPRNYGGSTDLSRVKQSMKNMREKEKEKPQGSKPLEIMMTGKERRNHEEWKAERDRYDKERIQRQMSDAGNWKRAWDVDKSSQENDDQSGYSSKVEPAKRPAGRIGSGRFDRGERDERPRSAVIGKGALQLIDHSQQPQRQHHHDQQQMQPQQHPHQHSQVGENKPSRGRGRGRGRGRSRGSVSGEKFPRPRTWSGGDDRFVECQKELLLVKFDNTAGDNSVEVEYDDDEFLSSPASSPKATQTSGTTPGRGPTGRTPNQVPKQQPRGGKQQQQKNKAPRHKDKPSGDTQHTPTEDKWNSPATSPIILDQVHAAYVNDETRVRTSSHSQSYGDSEEWDDCTVSSDMHEEDDDFDTTTDISTHDMLLECRLNPEAPEFLPSSPELITTPFAHPKVLPRAINGSHSCPLPQVSVTSQQPQRREEPNFVTKNNQPSSLSPDDPHVSKTIPVTKQVDNDKDNLISEIPNSVARSDKLKDVNASLLPTHGNDTKDTTPPSNAVDNINSASDIVDNINSASDIVDIINAASDAVDNINAASDVADNIYAASDVADIINAASDAVDNINAASGIVDNINAASDVADNMNAASDVADRINAASDVVDKINAASDVVDKINAASDVVDKINSASDVVDKINAASDVVDNINSASDVVDKINAASDVVDKINAAASDASNRLKEEIPDSSKATIGRVSPFLSKGLEQNSSEEDSKGTTKESTTIPVSEITQDGVLAKDFLRDVSKIQDPAEDSSRTVGLCADRAMNGDMSDQHKLNDEPTVFADHTPVTLSEQEVTTKTPKEGYGKQQNHHIPAESLAAKDGLSSDAIIPAGSQNSPIEDESALPTADVSNFS